MKCNRTVKTGSDFFPCLNTAKFSVEYVNNSKEIKEKLCGIHSRALIKSVEKIKKITGRLVIKTIVITFLCVVIMCYYLVKCGYTNKPTMNQPNTLQPLISNTTSKINNRQMRSVPVHDTIIKWRTKYKPLYDTLRVHNDSICNIALIQLYQAHNQLDSMQQIEVSMKDSTIEDQGIVIGAYKAMHKRDSLVMKDTVKYFNKAIRRRGFKWIIQAGVTGVVGGLIIGSQIKN